MIAFRWVNERRKSHIHLDQDVSQVLRHPNFRLFVAVFIIFCNFFIYAEDPIAHSYKEAAIPVVGQAWGLVLAHWPTNAGAALVKFLLALACFAGGLFVGRNVIHHKILRKRLKLQMFRGDQGTWMIMFFTTLMMLALGAEIYNALLPFLLPAAFQQWQLSSRMGVRNEVFTKLTAVGTWLGDFFTAFMVLDLMMQEFHTYPDWGVWMRTHWRRGNFRILMFWTVFPLGCAVVITSIALTDSSTVSTWDALNSNIFPTSELSRVFIASVITLLDLVIVVQDWEFPSFSTFQDVKLPGLNIAEVKHSGCRVHITGKWFNYGIIFMVMIFDSVMLKNQLFYRPQDYGQYVDPQGFVWSIAHATHANSPTNSGFHFSARHGNATAVAGGGGGGGGGVPPEYDIKLSSMYMGYSLSTKLVCTFPAMLGVLLFVYLLQTTELSLVDSLKAELRHHHSTHGFNTRSLSSSALATSPSIARIVINSSEDSGSGGGGGGGGGGGSGGGGASGGSAEVTPLTEAVTQQALTVAHDVHSAHHPEEAKAAAAAAAALGDGPTAESHAKEQHLLKKMHDRAVAADPLLEQKAHQYDVTEAAALRMLAVLPRNKRADAAWEAQHSHEHNHEQYDHLRPGLRTTLFVLCDDPKSSKTAGFTHTFLGFIILISIASFCIETLDPTIYTWVPNPRQQRYMESIFSVVFTTEFVVRCVVWESLWVKRPGSHSLPFARDVLNWVDLVSILPFYVELLLRASFSHVFTDESLSFMRLLRLSRVMRIFKLLRHFKGSSIMAEAGRQSIKPLLLPLFFLMVFSMLFAAVTFFVEPCYDPDHCVFTDIFNAGYFMMVTMTTVGYGDQIPQTTIGRAVAIIAMIFGSFFLSMPLAIIGNNFENAWESASRAQKLAEEQEAASITNAGLTDGSKPLLVLHPHAVFQSIYTKYFTFAALVRQLAEGLLASDMAVAAAAPAAAATAQGKGTVAVKEGGAAGGEALDVPDSPFMSVELTPPMRRNALQLLRRMDGELSSLVADIHVLTEPPKRRGGGARGGHKVKERLFDQNGQTVVSSQQEVEAAMASSSLKDKVWLLFEVPQSSRSATVLSYFLMACVVLSLTIFSCQTLPELQKYGPSTYGCTSIVRRYCGKLKSAGEMALPPRTDYWDADDGCKDVVASGTAQHIMPAACNTTNSTVSNLFNLDYAHPVCRRPQCIENDGWDLSWLWTPLEVFFVTVFTLELLIRFAVCRDSDKFVQDPTNWIDVAGILPFYLEVCISALEHGRVLLEVAGGDPSFSKSIRLLAVLRIFKMTRHFAGTAVLVEALQTSWKKLVLPLVFLSIFFLLFSAAFFAAERGVRGACLDPQLNKEFKIYCNVRGLPTEFTDIFGSGWVAIVTMTSVGYGGVTPITKSGKMVAVIAALFGSFYIAMPLTIVGGRFYKAYLRQKRFEDRARAQAAAQQARNPADRKGAPFALFTLSRDPALSGAPHQPPLTAEQRKALIRFEDLALLIADMRMQLEHYDPAAIVAAAAAKDGGGGGGGGGGSGGSQRTLTPSGGSGGAAGHPNNNGSGSGKGGLSVKMSRKAGSGERTRRGGKHKGRLKRNGTNSGNLRRSVTAAPGGAAGGGEDGGSGGSGNLESPPDTPNTPSTPRSGKHPRRGRGRTKRHGASSSSSSMPASALEAAGGGGGMERELRARRKLAQEFATAMKSRLTVMEHRHWELSLVMGALVCPPEPTEDDDD